MSIDVRVDRSSIKGVQLLLAGVADKAPRALARTLNRTASKSRTEASRAIRGQVKLSAAYVKDRLKVRKASPKNLSAAIATPSRGLLLSYYLYGITGVNQDTGRASRGMLLKYKKGFFSVANLDQPLKVKIKPDKPPIKLGPEWFILPKLKNANLPGLAKRENGKLRLHGPSLSQVFTDVKDEISGPMLDYQAEQFAKEVDTILRGY